MKQSKEVGGEIDDDFYVCVEDVYVWMYMCGCEK